MSSESRSVWRPLLAVLLWGAAFTLQADPGDPPTRVARLAFLDGGVSYRPAGAEDWAEPALNQPLTIGDQLWSDHDGRIELQLDGSDLRLGTDTAAGILNLSDEATQIQLSSGTLVVRVRQLADDESYEIDTPNVAFSILRPGTYRLTVDESGGATAVSVRSGQGEAVGIDGTGYTVRAGEYDTFSGVDQVQADSAGLGPQDGLDTWSAERDTQYDQSPSAAFVSPDVVGYQALDNQGIWEDTPDYGHVWFPSVDATWAPYQFGHWAFVAPWGYTWIDERPWGFAPFHYGRWVSWRQRWGWVPVPPPAPRSVYLRPVYAPALVAWVGTGATVGWFPLAPREVFVPSYPVSRRYLDMVNVSNTRVNSTVINNVYNTTIVNHVTVNNMTYANRSVPGAITAASTQALASARPLRREGSVDPRALASAPVRAFAPGVAPTRAALYGGRNAVARQPPQPVQTRVTAARMAPAAAAASRAANSPAPRTPAVRVVPPVRTLVSSRDLESARTAAASSATSGGRAPVHAGDIPAGPRAPSPANANSVLERQQSQEQQQLQARQDAERQRLQQQQEEQHRRLGTPATDTQQTAQRQAQAQAQAELSRRQQLDEQRTQQADQQRQVEQQAQRAQQEQQARAQQQQLRVQQQAQAQADQQRQLQNQRQQQAQEAQRQERERQLEQQHQQQTEQLQQQQARARAEMLERQQAAQHQQEQQHRASPSQPSPHQPR